MTGNERVSLFQLVDEAESRGFRAFAQVVGKRIVNIPVGLFARDDRFCPHRPVCEVTRARNAAKYAASAGAAGADAAPASNSPRNSKRS